MAKFDGRQKQDDSSVLDFYVGCYDKVKAADFPKSITSFTSDAFKEKKEKGQFVRYIKELELPSAIKSIPAEAFEGCEKLESVVIPDSVLSVEKNAFKNCVNLNKVVLSSNVRELPAGLFSGCSRLATIEVRNTSERLTIAKDAFSGCNLNILRFQITEGDNAIPSQDALKIRNQYFEDVKAKVNAGFFRKVFSNTNCGVEANLLNAFDKLLVSKLKELDPIRKGIVQIVGLNDYKRMPNVDYNGILTLSSEVDLPADLFMGQSLVGTWYWHKKRNQFVPYTVDIEERLLVERYKDFVTFLFSQNANCVEFSINGTKVESITKDEIIKSSINAKTSDIVPGNADSKNGIDLSDNAKSFEKALKKEVLKATAIPKVSSELPKLLWYSEEELVELKKQFENKKSWDYYISLSKELRNDTTQKRTIDSSLESIYGALNVKYDKNKVNKLEFNYDQEIKLYATFGEERPNLSPGPEVDAPEKKKTDARAGSKLNGIDFHYVAPSHKFFGREKLKAQIREKFNEVNVINIHGIGGIGKTSFAHLYIEKYYTGEKFYNKVCHIFSNESVVNDFVNGVNDYLKIDLSGIRDYRRQLQAVLDKLDEIQGKNLLVLDINITDIRVLELFPQYINEFASRLPDWHVLLLSRASIVAESTERIYLEDFGAIEEDKEAISEIFKYNLRGYPCPFNEDELQKMFEKLMYHPLLVEHLAAFVSRRKMKSFGDICSIIKDFADNDVTDRKYCGTGISEIGKVEKYQKVLDFLEKIITYGQFEGAEQIVLRHFAIWPYDYIKFEDIQKLLKGYGIKYLRNTLDNLVDKTVLQEKDGSCRMHGSLSEILKKQIFDGSYQLDYSQYFNNIINSSYIKDVNSPIAKCIYATLGNDDFMKEFYWNKLPNKEISEEDLENKFNMVKIPGGTYEMGEDKWEATVSDFYICKYAVSKSDWDFGIGDNYPVTDVSWYDAVFYIMRLNRKTGLTFHLPSEAEWESACRYSNSDRHNIDDVAWHWGNSFGRSHPVSETPKPICDDHGIKNMLGNVSEWCSDSDERYRVYRGGSWAYVADSCRVTCRGSSNPYRRDNILGFRLALSLQLKE